MLYPKINVLTKLWDSFEPNIKQLIEIDQGHLEDIKKLMTAEAVINMSLHEIYEYTKYIHNLSETLLKISKNHANDSIVIICEQLWLEILKKRNQNPLKIKHYRKLDSECDFKFSLQLMEGQPNRFKEIQVLDPRNTLALKEVIEIIHRLDKLAYGSSFAHLPLMKDKVLSSILTSEDIICLLAKDHNDQIVGYSWGILLRDIKTNQSEKVNIFWVMDITRDPDFIDKNAQIGNQLRVKMLEAIKARNDCDFEGYSHLVGHKFHMRIVADQPDNMEKIYIGNETFEAKNHLSYDSNIGEHLLTHFIKLTKNNYAYPEYKEIKPGIFHALWRAAPSLTDFVLGGIATIDGQSI